MSEELSAAERDALLETLLMKAPIGAAMVDRSYRYLLVNESLARTHGVSIQDHLGKSIEQIAPLLWPALRPILERVLEGEEFSDRALIDQGLTKPGDQHHYLASFVPVRAQGVVIGAAYVVDDVTALKKSEEAIRLCSEFYAILSRTNMAVSRASSTDALYREVCEVCVSVGKFAFAWIGVPENDRLVRAASAGIDDGYIAESFISIDPENERAHGPAGQAYLRGSYVVVNDFLAASMTKPWHELAQRVGVKALAAFPIREAGRVVAILTVYAKETNYFTPDFVATLADVTPILSVGLDHFADAEAKRRDEEALRMRDRALLAISQGIVIVDAQVTGEPIIFASESFLALTGYGLDEVLGRNCRFLQGPESDRTVVRELSEAIHAGKDCNVEIRNYRKDGSVFWNSLAISPVRDERGTVTHFVGVQTDVTDRKELYTQLLQAQKMDALGTLAGGVAHDFNNMLLVIRGYSAILAKRVAEDDLREMADRIDIAVQRAADFTRRLLTFSRSGVVSPEVINVNDVVGETLKLLERVIGASIAVTTDFTSDLAQILIDRGQLEQVVLNLVTNARESMPSGGALSVRSATVNLGEGYAALHPDVVPGPHVMIEVTDTGIGMDETTQNHLFEPFFTTKEHGTGLGLATVYGIVRQNGGHLWLHSELGRGTTFRIYFPVADTLENRVAPARNAVTSLGGDETILLVEDIDEVRLLLARALDDLGYHVLQAPNGRVALELVEDLGVNVDVLVTDVVMPQMNGRDLARQLLITQPQLKILFTSGHPSNNVSLDAEFVANADFIEKPYLADEIAFVIRTLLTDQPH
jgi:two-component system cell cycle sensor histidine kinase/response regulator CckA